MLLSIRSAKKIYAGSLFFAVALTLTASSLFAASTPRTAILQELQGNVEVQIQGSDWQPATENLILQEGDQVRTQEKSSVKIILDDGGQTGDLKLREKSHLRFDRMTLNPDNGEKQTLLNLALGKVLVHAQKLQGESTFEIKTPTSTTGVRGTIFEVAVDKNN